jgi:beta-glucanase (GH16 family)
MNFLSIRTIALAVVAVAPLGSATSFTLPSKAAAGPSCGKTKTQKSIARHWRCAFADNFSGTTLNPRRWIAQRTDTSGFRNGTTACFVNSPHNISVSNGTLNLTARREATPFMCKDPQGDFTTEYTSGMVSTWGRFSQAYGRFEVRAKVWSARVQGLHSAFWLWPQDSSRYGEWPTSGEIDIAELYSAYPDRAVPYIHYTSATPDPMATNTSCMIKNLAAFHTYAVEWTRRRIKVIYDGKTCLTNRWNPASPLARPQPFDHPFIVALTQALGVGDNAFDPAATPLPATTVVDYVRVWKR